MPAYNIRYPPCYCGAYRNGATASDGLYCQQEDFTVGWYCSPPKVNDKQPCPSNMEHCTALVPPPLPPHPPPSPPPTPLRSPPPPKGQVGQWLGQDRKPPPPTPSPPTTSPPAPPAPAPSIFPRPPPALGVALAPDPPPAPAWPPAAPPVPPAPLAPGLLSRFRDHGHLPVRSVAIAAAVLAVAVLALALGSRRRRASVKPQRGGGRRGGKKARASKRGSGGGGGGTTLEVRYEWHGQRGRFVVDLDDAGSTKALLRLLSQHVSADMGEQVRLAEMRVEAELADGGEPFEVDTWTTIDELRGAAALEVFSRDDDGDGDEDAMEAAAADEEAAAVATEEEDDGDEYVEDDSWTSIGAPPARKVKNGRRHAPSPPPPRERTVEEAVEEAVAAAAAVMAARAAEQEAATALVPAPLVPIDLEEDDADARSHALMLNRREVQAEYEEEEPSRSWKLVTSQPGAAGKGYAKHKKAEKRVLAFD